MLLGGPSRSRFASPRICAVLLRDPLRRTGRLRRIRCGHQFLVPARRLASRGTRRPGDRAGPRRDRHRRSKLACRDRPRAPVPAPQRGPGERLARRLRRQAGLLRRHAGHSRLPARSRRLCAAVPAPDNRQHPLAQGRLPAASRRPHRMERGPAAHRARRLDLRARRRREGRRPPFRGLRGDRPGPGGRRGSCRRACRERAGAVLALRPRPPFHLAGHEAGGGAVANETGLGQPVRGRTLGDAPRQAIVAGTAGSRLPRPALAWRHHDLRGDHARRSRQAPQARRPAWSAADRDQRRRDARPGTPGAARRDHLHPPWRDARDGRPQARRQCRAPPEAAGRDAPSLRRGAGGGERDAALPRWPALLARRTRQRLSGGAARGLRHAAGRAGRLRRDGAARRYPTACPTTSRRHRPRARARGADGLRAVLPHRARHRALRPRRAASCARGAARRPTRPCASASASPKSTRPSTICCSSASSRRPPASRPTSTSTSSTSGAKR